MKGHPGPKTISKSGGPLGATGRCAAIVQATAQAMVQATVQMAAQAADFEHPLSHRFRRRALIKYLGIECNIIDVPLGVESG